MVHTLPALPYAYDALEPHMDAMTVNIHHTKHHQTYVTKLNEALASNAELAALDLTALQSSLGAATPAARNMGGGHYNHSLYWQNMAPIGSSNPAPFGPLKDLLDRSFGTYDAFKEQFSQAAITRFASGWAFLTLKADGTLAVHNTPNHDNPLMNVAGDLHGIPILTCDVWEHAYYLKHQGRRNEFVAAWWNLVNWDAVCANYTNYAAQGHPVPL
jgi:Fe-Mn family superoxide dismutase